MESTFKFVSALEFEGLKQLAKKTKTQLSGIPVQDGVMVPYGEFLGATGKPLRAYAKELMEESGFLAIYWHEDDIRNYGDTALTDDQVYSIMDRLESAHDCECGMTWSQIDDAIQTELSQPA